MTFKHYITHNNYCIHRIEGYLYRTMDSLFKGNYDITYYILMQIK